ncbi:MAG: ABC transporter ATP-binding protein [Treponema sp.]|nr:ABC transporter ATP-binding protein [Treponema sp.]MCL2272031.1 ABC transporter ATP-binding protein [Treponema sp.]
MTPLLEVRGLCTSLMKNGNEYKIINNVSFNIDKGEIVGLAGESGSGKSMTAMSILNLLPDGIKISGGELIFNDLKLSSLSDKEMNSIRGGDISIVFQDVRQSLNPLMKVGKQIIETLELSQNLKSANLKNTYDTQNRKSALEMLSSLGFKKAENIFDAYPHQLSGGMCQRVLTAMAVIRRPKLLLADEPSSSLDEESQNLCLSLLTEMNRSEKMSLLVISHDLSVIQNICSRFLVMYSGIIVEEGPASAFFSPLHPYTKALINSIPDKQKRGKKLENIPGKVNTIFNPADGCPFAPRCKKAKDICRREFPSPIISENRRVFCFFPEVQK